MPTYARTMTLPLLTIAALILTMVAALRAVNAAAAQPGEELSWPRVYKENGRELTVFQPQIEDWENGLMKGRAAVAVRQSDKDAPVFGAIWLQAAADVDKAANIVTCGNIQITKGNFPTAVDKQSDYLEFARRNLQKETLHLALDQVQASYAISRAVDKVTAAQVQNVPPLIYYSSSPALLVLVDGDPILRPLKTAGVERVINSPALILKTGGMFYLFARNRWYLANDLDAKWSVIDNPPSSLTGAKAEAIAAKNVDLLPPPANASSAVVPIIYLSTMPAELIQTAGAPEMVAIQGTRLLEVKNSDNAIFMNIPTQEYFLLISGRWFKAKSLGDSSWTWVSAKELPGDFAKIPETDPKANVLASVGGTPQAQESLIANSIPQTATVKRKEATLQVVYDGQPKFKPVTDTTLRYAVNTPTPVVEVDPNAYYAVQNGVWFTSSTALGPWAVATSVPGVIYTIPPSSPIHYVTYVRILEYTPETVRVGYTPGYLGTVVSQDGTVVYGTGYNYEPYVGSAWVGQPYSYGSGAGFACNSMAGYAFGFATAAALAPWWGAYSWGWHNGVGYGNVSLNHTNFYNNWGGVAGYSHSYGYNAWTGNAWSGSWASGFNPYSGRDFSREGGRVTNAYNGNYAAGRQGTSYNPRTGTSAAGREGVAGNAYSGNYAAGREGGEYNARTGIGAVGKETAAGNAYTGRQVDSKEGAVFDTKTDSGIAEKNGEVYADKDGNIYRHTSGGWQQYGNGGWQNSTKPQSLLNKANEAGGRQNEVGGRGGEFDNRTNELDQERNSRQIGEQRTRNYRSHGGGHGRR